MWQVRGPGEQEELTDNRFSSSSSGSRSPCPGETTPLVVHDVLSAGNDLANNGAEQQQVAVVPGVGEADAPSPHVPQFCRSQPQHHFQYRSISVEYKVPLNDPPQDEADLEDEGGDHTGAGEGDHYGRDGRSTPPPSVRVVVCWKMISSRLSMNTIHI